MRAKVLKIVWKFLLGLFLVCYVTVAILNFSIVQSYLGAKASAYFSSEWGGKVRIGALHFGPFSHLMIDDIELISPTQDTLFTGEAIRCSFKHFPISSDGIEMNRVFIRRANYHLEIRENENTGEAETNLQYIIDYFSKGQKVESEESLGHFIVKVGELRLREVRYKQDLLGEDSEEFKRLGVGVSIPHMRYRIVHGLFKDIRVDNDDVQCRIIDLDVHEASGLHVKHISAEVQVSPYHIIANNMDVETDSSRILLDAALTYNTWEDMSDYLNTVKHTLTLKPGTDVNLCDAAYWAPILWGSDNRVQVTGYFYGPISDLHAENAEIVFGKNSSLRLDGQISGLPEIEATCITAEIDGLHTTAEDLLAVKHPDWVNIVLPNTLAKAGDIEINAMLDGGLKSCHAAIDMRCELGDIQADAMVKYDEAKQTYFYVGDFNSSAIQLCELLPNDWITRSGFHISVQGSGNSLSNMNTTLDGELFNTRMRGHDIDRATISADIDDQLANIDFNISDSLLMMEMSASADLREGEEVYAFNIDLNRGELSELGIVNSDSTVALTTRIRGDLRGNELERLSGTLAFENPVLQLGSQRTEFGDISISIREHNRYKNVSLASEWCSLSMKGYFAYTAFPDIVQDFCDRFLPTYYSTHGELDTLDLKGIADANIDMDLLWTDERNRFSNLLPGIQLAYGTSLHGNYNYTEALKLVLRSDSIVYDNIVLHDIGFNSSQQGSIYQMKLNASDLSIGNARLLDNLRLDLGAANHTSTISLRWDDDAATTENEGNLEFFLTSTSEGNFIAVSRPIFYVAGKQWNLSCPSGIHFSKQHLCIDNLKIYGDDQSIALKLDYDHTEKDALKVAFDDFRLDYLADILLHNSGFSLEGILDGQFMMQGFDETPYFNANLTIDSCMVNNQNIGNVEATAGWNANLGRLYIDLAAAKHQEEAISPIQAHGFIALREKAPEINMDLGFEQLNLNVLEPFLSSFSSRFSGNLEGGIHISGNLSNPKIEGMAILENGSLLIDITGVTYFVNDSLYISNNNLTLQDFVVKDSRGNKAHVDGTIIYNENNIWLDLGLNTDRILVLDNMLTGEDFYGTVLASAQGTVQGPANQLNLTVSATTLPGSQLFVPISNQKQIQEQNYIHFVSNTPARSIAPKTDTKTSDATVPSFHLEANVAITPSLKLSLPMDFSELGATVTATGGGDIRLTLDGNNDPTILGNYEFTSGNFSLSLMQLIERNFSIEQGSSLNFPGNINDARFNINAIYSQRVPLSSLTGNVSSENQNIQVEDIIKLSGTLQAPSIGFDIRLPNADQTVSDEVFTYIDRANERDMLNQAMSLLVLGKFSSSGISTDDNIANSINGVSVVANSISSIVSNFIKIVDIDFNYKAETDYTTEQFDVDISKEWNKIYFESSFGYGGDSRSVENPETSNTLVGDMLVGYKITPYLHLFGFNRTNTNEFTRTELPYKQGFGIKLTHDFNGLHDIWRRRETTANRK